MEWATKYKGLRFQLTAWNIAAFLVVTFLAFSGFYIVTKQILSTHTDNLLISHSAGVINLVTGNTIGIHSMLTQEAFNREFSEIPGMLIVAMDNKGQIFNASATLNRSADVFEELFSRIYKEKKQFFANKNINGSQMRFLATPIYDKDQLQGVILVAHPIDIIQKSLDSLLLVLGVSFLILIIPIFLGGYFLVKKAFGPVTTMSDKLKKISAENLDERIDNPKTEDELSELADTFNLLLDRLHQAFLRERQFIGDVAHELKTPLSTIRTTIEIAQSKPRSISQYKQTLNEVLIDNNKLATTLNNILDLAWSESQTANINEIVNLSQIVVDLKDIAVKLAAPKHISVKSRIAPNIQVLGKSDKLGRAILNIIDNAIKFTPERGNVLLTLISNNDHAVLHIKDTGIGISQQDIPRVFDRFYRGARSNKTLGSGLGLAIAQSIIKTFHGQIEVESKVGQGTTFIVMLPLIKSS